MDTDKKDNDLIKRMQKTLNIIEQRDYNVTLKKLSQILIGGPVDSSNLKKIINNNKSFDFDGLFVANRGKLQSKKCLQRLERNIILQPFYQKVAQEFISEYTNMCPWIKCIMNSGSMASNGLIDGEDIDLNIIVENNTKYFSWLIGLLLSVKYSIKYRKQFNVKWYNFIKGVICICVIWELRQVTPFKRRDGQIAYELLLNSNVLYNREFYNKLIKINSWINEWFPQLLFDNKQNNFEKLNKKYYNRKIVHRFFEPISKALIFLLYHGYRSLIFWNEPLNERIDHVIEKQHPYSIIEFNDDF